MKIQKLTIATNSIGGNMGRTLRISGVGGWETHNIGRRLRTGRGANFT
jgi:hypothetical protein